MNKFKIVFGVFIFLSSFSLDGFARYDTEWFKSLGDSYSVDGDKVFYKKSEILQADSRSFVNVGNGYAKDEKFIYRLGENFGDNLGNFTVLNKDYSKDGRSVYFKTIVLYKAIPYNFKILTFGYSTDLKNVFYEGRNLNISAKGLGIFNENFIKNNSFGYFKNKKIHISDGVTLNFLGKTHSKDSSTCFYERKQIYRCIVRGFSEINTLYSKDEKSVFYKGKKLGHVSGDHFEIIGDYAKDRNFVFFKGIELKNLNLNYFKILKSGFAKDNKKVFYNGELQNKIDGKSFKQLDLNYSKDRNFIFYKNKIISKNTNKFKIYLGLYGKVGERLFLNGNEIIGQKKILFLKENDLFNFYDVSERNTHFEAVHFVKEKGIMTGYEGNLFRPNKKINRAEFLKTILTSNFSHYKLSSCDISKFKAKDIGKDAWYSSYFCFANKKNFISGYSYGVFKPSNNINLVESLKIIFRAYKIQPLDKFYGGEWWKKYFLTAKEYGILKNVEKNASEKINRTDLAQMIFNLEK